MERRYNPNYIFRRNAWGHEQAVITGRATCMSNIIQLTPSTYDRFARLANSGNYIVEILDADSGVAWQMRRADHSPVTPKEEASDE